jgi:predicted nucleotidyltransferase
MKHEMTITEKFDRAKKLAEGGDLNSGFKTESREFHSYLTNDDWDKFLSVMDENVRNNQYGEGKGSELKEYTKNGVHYPPKMASYASSSRFMHEMGKDIDGFEFEKQLETGLGGYPASLDGFLESKNLYVEAKCHEFYSKTKPELREGHKKLYDAIVSKLGTESFNYCAPDGVGGKVSFEWKGKDCKAFDLKQMCCHLCGIANDALKKIHEGGCPKVNFIYLIYRPTMELLDRVEKELDREKISELFKEELENAGRIDFKEIFQAVLSYFNVKKNFGIPEGKLISAAQNLTFMVCTQEDFKSTVEKIEECA